MFLVLQTPLAACWCIYSGGTKRTIADAGRAPGLGDQFEFLLLFLNQQSMPYDPYRLQKHSDTRYSTSRQSTRTALRSLHMALLMGLVQAVQRFCQILDFCRTLG